MEKLNQQKKRNGLLDSALILCILSGTLFDLADYFLNTNLSTWSEIHLILKDVQIFGMSALAFTLCSYSNIKIKAFTFMFTIWRIVVVFYNAYLPSYPSQYILLPLYAVYIIWIYRSLTTSNIETTQREIDNIDHNIHAYNILFPISTFRGLLQILFTFKNPKYETRMLLYRNKLYFVLNNRFTFRYYDKKALQDLVEKAGAILKPHGMPDFEKIDKIDKLIGKRAITGIRDCRRLEL